MAEKSIEVVQILQARLESNRHLITYGDSKGYETNILIETNKDLVTAINILTLDF